MFKIKSIVQYSRRILNSRDIPVGVHDVHVVSLHGGGGGHARVSVTAGVGARS